AGDVLRHLPLLPLAFGAATFIGLFAMKFLGPRRPAFVPRVAIVFVMLVLAGLSAWVATSGTAAWLQSVNIGLGVVLFYWDTRGAPPSRVVSGFSRTVTVGLKALMTHTITLIPGDGIGPEVTEAVV